jgi:long-chain acyl-CoA synthetase
MPRLDGQPLPFGGTLPDAVATTPRLLAHNAAKWPDAVAIRQKDLGIWQQMTWRECLDRTRAIALGLQDLGIGEGDVVSFIGQNRPDLLLTEIAAHALGALSLGVYKDSLKDELAYLVNHADVRVVIAEDEEQVDKFLELGEELPGLNRIIYVDPRGMRKYADPRLMAIADLCAAGERRHAADPSVFETLVEQTRPEAPAILCTTSGTTSHPKIATLHSGPFLKHALSLLTVDPKGQDDDYVSVLPLPWIGEQVNAVAHFLLTRIRLNFVEDEETTTHDMREIGPTHILQAPRVWEAIAADIKARMMDSTPLKRFIFALAMKLGERATKAHRRSRLANFLVGRALRDRLGLSHMRSATTGGAPLGPDVFQFFRSIGVPLRQVYGQTEMVGIYCAHRVDDVDFDTVGPPIRDVEIRIDNPDRNGLGEVVARHPGMFTGYYRNEEATRADLRNGWMHTGDAGYLNERGHLVVLDRMRDLAILAGGDRFSPQYLENRLKFSPFVGECVVLGQGRPFVTAMICIRYSIISKWAEARRIAFTTYSDLAARPEVRALMRQELEAINARLPEHQRIARMLLLYKELDADDGELTRTRKLRRGTINERYADLIKALYGDSYHIDVDTTITLQDGRHQRIRARVVIETLLPEADVSATCAAAE